MEGDSRAERGGEVEIVVGETGWEAQTKRDAIVWGCQVRAFVFRGVGEA